LAHVETPVNFFQTRFWYSVSIFPVFGNLCSLLVCSYVFDVFLFAMTGILKFCCCCIHCSIVLATFLAECRQIDDLACSILEIDRPYNVLFARGSELFLVLCLFCCLFKMTRPFLS